MVRKGLKKYLLNPSIGLSAPILYILTFLASKDIGLSLLVSIIFSVLSDVIIRYYTKTNVCGLTFLLVLGAFIPTTLVWFIFNKSFFPDIFYIVLFEIIFVTLLTIAKLSKTYISIFFGRKQNSIKKVFLGEFFDVARLAQYALTLHLFIILIYRMVEVNSEYNGNMSFFIHFLLSLIFLFAIIVLEEVKTMKTVDQLRKEEWLPIVSESGEVTGRIARSVSYTMKNRFMHPVVRVALIHEGKIYLQKRPDNSTFASGTYDHPFEKYMLFDHEIDTTVKNTISRAIGLNSGLTYNFLLKYVYENEDTKRLIFLYVSRIQDNTQLTKISQLKGKFWTTKQIDESFVDDELFSECFQLEYEYIKNTVLLSDMIAKEIQEQP